MFLRRGFLDAANANVRLPLCSDNLLLYVPILAQIYHESLEKTAQCTQQQTDSFVNVIDAMQNDDGFIRSLITRKFLEIAWAT